MAKLKRDKILAFCCFLVTLVFFLPISTLAAQDSKAGAGSTSSPPSTRDDGPKAADQHVDKKISAKEAEELFREVTQILHFASRDTSLPIKRDVKPKLTGRDEVVAYLHKNMAEDKDAKRLQRSELVLKKFGLLPRDFDLSKFLVGLLREQIAGYYDPKTKAVNLLNWVDVAAQRPVLAHELTHALQDQSFNLNKWLKKSDVDLETKRKPSARDVQNDETSEAMQAVVEGQAMAVLVDYILIPTGQSLIKAPEVAKAIEDGMLTGTPDSVQFRDAPIYLREALTFPYRYGLEFEAALLRAGGTNKAYVDVFRNPPRMTRQIMQPETYLASERIEPLPLPDFKHIFRDYDRFDIGAIGEFDTSVLIDQYAGDAVSKELYPQWRGGYYYAARRKENKSAPLVLVYVSRWATPEKASQFAGVYAKYLPKRYTNLQKDSDFTDAAKVRSWKTEDGPVFIDVAGDTVLITESLDQAIVHTLEGAIFSSR